MRGAAKHIVRYQADEAVLTELDSLCAAIKKNRKLESARPLDLSLKQLLSFEKLKDINKASDFLANSINTTPFIVMHDWIPHDKFHRVKLIYFVRRQAQTATNCHGHPLDFVCRVLCAMHFPQLIA